jgi:hypothetical protein
MTRMSKWKSAIKIALIVSSAVALGIQLVPFRRDYSNPPIVKEAGEAAEAVQEGEMPLTSYVLLHPSARLSPDEKQALIRGLKATLGSPSKER